VSPGAKAALVAGGVVAADQAAKAIVRGSIDRGTDADLFLGIRLVNTRNTGIAFGLLEGGGALLAVFALVALAALLVFFQRHQDRALVWLPTGLLIGGAVGNLIDRVAAGEVTDFVDLGPWPAFNVADVAITFGVLSLLYVLEGPPARARR
jgi:signal peptidase II